MATYYMNEGAFEIPDLGFEDRTTHLLEARSEAHGDVDLFIERERFPVGKTLRELVAAHLEAEKKRLTGFTVLAESESDRKGVPVLEVAMRFRHDGLAYYQKQAHIALDDVWMRISINTPMNARAACDGWVEGMLASLEWRAR